MTQDFVETKQLEFVQSPETGDFWGGVDEWEEHRFELFFTAGQEGPTTEQIQSYESLRENLAAVLGSMTDRFRSHIATMDSGATARWRKGTVELDIVSIYEAGADVEFDICCRVSRRVFFFPKYLDFVAGFRRNLITTFEVM